MPDFTDHYQLEKLQVGEPFSSNGQKYTTADRDAIDRLAFLGAEGHHHNGLSAVDVDPTVGVSLTVDTTTGYLPAGLRVSYAWTLVDVNGFESAPSPAVFVDLPAQPLSPASPAGSVVLGTGTLPPGGYFYVLSAYTGTSNSSETPASGPFYATITALGEAILDLPALPSGTDGFNVYRLGPGSANYVYLDSIDMTGLTPPTTYTDDGSVVPVPNRLAPNTNTTASTNTVTATLPGPVPVGFTWNLYRTIVVGQWDNSLLASITALDGGGLVLTSYTDMGLSAGAGAPPSTSEMIGSPSKIDLGSETTGTLAPSAVGAYPVVLTFAFGGPVAAQSGSIVWVNDFPAAQVLSVRAALGRSSTPNADPVIVDVLQGTGTNPTYASIFSAAVTPSTTPRIPVGLQIGTPAVPVAANLIAGDSLSVDILESGGGSGTDHDLTVTIVLLVSGVSLPALA